MIIKTKCLIFLQRTSVWVWCVALALNLKLDLINLLSVTLAITSIECDSAVSWSEQKSSNNPPKHSGIVHTL